MPVNRAQIAVGLLLDSRVGSLQPIPVERNKNGRCLAARHIFPFQHGKGHSGLENEICFSDIHPLSLAKAREALEGIPCIGLLPERVCATGRGLAEGLVLAGAGGGVCLCLQRRLLGGSKVNESNHDCVG